MVRVIPFDPYKQSSEVTSLRVHPLRSPQKLQVKFGLEPRSPPPGLQHTQIEDGK